MKFKILSSKKKEMEFKIQGEDHTFARLLTSALLKDKDVEMAHYRVDHPLVGTPKFYFKTKKSEPKNVLKKTLKRLEKDVASLKVRG